MDFIFDLLSINSIYFWIFLSLLIFLTLGYLGQKYPSKNWRWGELASLVIGLVAVLVFIAEQKEQRKLANENAQLERLVEEERKIKPFKHTFPYHFKQFKDEFFKFMLRREKYVNNKCLARSSQCSQLKSRLKDLDADIPEIKNYTNLKNATFDKICNHLDHIIKNHSKYYGLVRIPKKFLKNELRKCKKLELFEKRPTEIEVKSSQLRKSRLNSSIQSPVELVLLQFFWPFLLILAISFRFAKWISEFKLDHLKQNLS